MIFRTAQIPSVLVSVVLGFSFKSHLSPVWLGLGFGLTISFYTRSHPLIPSI